MSLPGGSKLGPYEIQSALGAGGSGMTPSTPTMVGTYVASGDGKKFLINSGSTKQGNEPLTLFTNWAAELKK